MKKGLTCFKDITGQKFNRWTVIKVSKRKAGTNYYWWCVCECGTIKEVRGTALIHGGSKSCRCLRIEVSKKLNSLEFGLSAFNGAFHSYKKDAKRRGYSFELTREEFKIITQQNCTYCGHPPSNMRKARNGNYTYSGIDRIDNNIGYNITNIVPCCADCNRAKYQKTSKEFMDYIDRLLMFQALRKELK